MPRKDATKPEEKPSPHEHSPLPGTGADGIDAGNGQDHDVESRRPAELPSDPRELRTVALGSSNEGPKLRLLRSDRYRQMQIRFDEDLDDRYKGMLKDAGWRDRTQEEGIWTKQLPREGEKWRDVLDAERLFQEIADGIRADRGLGAAQGPSRN